MRIDIHNHYFPEEYLDALEACGVDVRVARGLQAGGTQAELDRRFRLMDEAGVDVQVLSPSAFHPYIEDVEDAVRCARMINDLTRELCSRYPDRLLGFVSLPLPHMEESLEEMARGIDELGMVGATITTSVLGRVLSDPLLEPLYAELNRRKLPLFLHPAGCGVDSPMIVGHNLEWLIGASIEDLVAATHIMKSGVLRRYEDLNIIVPHLGGGLSIVMQRFDNSAEAGRTQWNERPSGLARRLWFDTVGWNPPAFTCAANVFGTDRLLFGTDFPYLNDEQYVTATTYFREGLSDAELETIDSGNAMKLLGLDEWPRRPR